MMVSMPDDAKIIGYVRSHKNEFEFDCIYRSIEHDFVGTEMEFIGRGLAYTYVQVGPHKRLVIQQHNTHKSGCHGH